MDEVCLLSDAFPPIIDGVVNAVTNYGKNLAADGWQVSAVVPDYEGADDSAFPYPVIRYPSLDFRDSIGYTVGNPFDVATIRGVSQRKISILHSHCPFASTYLGRSLREKLDVPLILTYHTKYDLDIANAIHIKAAKDSAVRALVENVSACDELWVVSRGAGENIKSLGYEGEYIVMENGVDLPKKRAEASLVREVTKDIPLPEGVPVFLFVGRLMWYKGIRIILDALAVLKDARKEFRMVFVGTGTDEAEIRAYAESLNLMDKVIFTGPVRGRDALSAWYTRADLFLFPSTFDTNGLVVREAAACSLGSVLVRGSCAAEGVTDGVDGLLIAENAASLAVCLSDVMKRPEVMKQIGEAAARNIYISWEDAVKKAEERYQIVLDRYLSGHTSRKARRGHDLFHYSAELMETLDRAARLRDRAYTLAADTQRALTRGSDLWQDF